jgi:hypothetical protein
MKEDIKTNQAKAEAFREEMKDMHERMMAIMPIMKGQWPAKK